MHSLRGLGDGDWLERARRCVCFNCHSANAEKQQRSEPWSHRLNVLPLVARVVRAQTKVVFPGGGEGEDGCPVRFVPVLILKDELVSHWLNNLVREGEEGQRTVNLCLLQSSRSCEPNL